MKSLHSRSLEDLLLCSPLHQIQENVVVCKNLYKLPILIFLFIPNIIVFGAEPKDPSPAEKTAFENKLKRLKDNAGLHPHLITEILQSLQSQTNTNGIVEKMIECPKGSKVKKVTLKVKTKQIKFDRKLTINGQKLGVGDNDIGWYQWSFITTIEDSMKVIDACNFVMLDSATMIQQEADPPFGPIADEALLYHEMLHGQLVIDSFMTSPNWQKEICNCNFNTDAIDTDHALIGPLEEAYLEELLKKFGIDDPEATVVSPSDQKAEKDGKFKIELPIGDKEEISVQTYFPKGSNIKGNMVQIEFNDGKVVVTGELSDKTKKGLLVVIIDPPNAFYFVGLEKAILIEPASAGIPTLSHWGLIVLLLLFLIVGSAALFEVLSTELKSLS